MAGSRSDEGPSTVVIEYSSGKELMKHGAEALHEHVSTRTKAAMGRAPPQLEVRVQNLSLAAEIVVSSDAKDDKPELPTVANEFKKRFSRFSAKKHKVTKRILQDINIVLKPGTMTLVLGQPGSGKSSLMKVLSGRFPMAKNIKMSGEVSFNGTPLEDQHLKRCLPQFASYVTQRDHHFPTLTVKETVSFAHECCGGEWLSERTERVCTAGSPQENQAAMEAARALNKHLPEVMIHQLGLEECQNTVVGDAMTRGVSGGERKRVTTGEMLFGDKSLLLMDEISTGLDSAATYDIIKTQRSLAKTFQKTVVIALLQPPPEVFDLFDNVLILNKGHVMYNGPREQALGYFEGLGFKCPPNRDVADFLMDLGTRQQRRYENPESEVILPRKVHEFVARFEQSVFFETAVADLNEPMSPERIRDKEEFYDTMPEFHQSFFASTMTVLRRQGILMKRNTPFLVSRGIMVTVMGLLYASVFWQLDPKNAQVLMGILFQSVLFLAMGHAAQIPTFMAAREIFYKQRGANFYRTSSYVLANGVNQIPLAVLETLLFGTMQYWMCGLVSSFVPYVIFELMLFLMNLSFASLFFFLAAIAPDLHIAKPFSMVVIVFFVLHAGFVITEDQMPDYLVWVFWINPIAWCLRGLAINQYRRAEFDVCIYDGVDYCEKYGMEMSKYSLSLFNVKSDESWLYWGFVFLGVSYVIFMFLAWATLEFKRYESPEHVTLDEEENHKTTNIDQLSASSVSSGADYALVSTPTDRKTPTQQQLETVVTVAPERQTHVAPVTLAFRNLWYSVPDPKDPKGPQLDLLKGISGYAMPGTITALMGSSGAGKTTLMDVIAGRKTGGKIKGDILLNGYPATDLAIRRATGYCEQMDIHSDGSTIREALTFSAFLRQSSDVPDSQKYDSVEEALELLDLHPIADQIIRGSSVEQMKRLTIGVELAAQPSVLFLDEPTSGLDARSAKVIMDGVRKVADSGRTVVCTIHQPSAEVFSVFDSLLLLKRGGYTVFFGDLGSRARELINYFEAIPNVAPLEPGYNPATWMLEVIGAGVGHAGENDTDFVARFNGSEKKALLEENLARPGICTPAPSSVELSFAKKRAATNTTQARFMIKRFLDLYWRTPSYNFTRYMMYIIVALLFGLLYLNSNFRTYQGINAGVGLVFMSTLFVGMTSYNSVLPIASQDRSAFYRERASQTYNAVWYFVGSTVAEVPYVITSTLLFTAIFFPMVGFSDADRFFLYWAGVALFVLFQTYFGQLLVYAMPSVEVAVIIGVLLNSIFMLFIGYNPPSSTIPSGYKWLYYITPHRYIISVLVSTAFGDCGEGQEGISDSIGCARLENLPPTVSANLTVKGYVEEVFDMHHDDIGKNLGIFIGCIFLIRILAALALRYINHQKR